jgi:hypothetical protein
MTVTTHNHERPLNLPPHEQLEQETMMMYALATHTDEPTTREQQISVEAHRQSLVIRYQVLKGIVAAEEMKRVHLQAAKGLYAIADHHDGLHQAAQSKEIQSKDLQAKVEQFTVYDLETAVIHMEKIASITFQNLTTELGKSLNPPRETEIVIREVKRPGFLQRMLGG